MHSSPPSRLYVFLAGLMTMLGVSLQAQLSDVTQPGDPIIASSSRSPGSEGVANAIDNQPTKYLNFDSGQGGFIPSGFVVSPSVGNTHVTGVALMSANDAPERDPKAFTLEGSNDDTISAFNSGNWEFIVGISNITPWTTVFGTGTPDPSRFKTQRFTFPNRKAYKHYRWITTETQTTPNGCCMQIAEVELLGTTLPSDVTQPGDTIFASSSRSPGSEGVANAIDNQPTKYLNFDSGQGGFLPSGFAVSPSIGRTLVNAISMQSANDAPERDPKTFTLEGSNDPTLTGYNTGTWELITTVSNIPAWTTVFGTGTPDPSRFKTQTFFFDNPKPYRHYRWVVTETQTTPNGCCMQIAEVEFLGTSAPRDVTQPGDPLIASSSRSPGSEGVANAIDDQPTKYLNFDSGQGGFIPSGFVVSPRIGATTVIGLTMQSANDAPERDPRAVTLEGSNDDTISAFNSGNWELITAINNITPWTTIFGTGTPDPSRFKTQEFYFLNNKSYKHYRWITTETQTTPNGCCMQIAEVELLAVPQAGNTNEIDTLIRRQPKDTPVLLGSQATFRVLLTGPWNIQWQKNGVPIPGATAASYTTPAATQADDGALFKAVVSSPQGTQVSDEVMLSIFAPSTTESIGLSWRGSGANGAPTDMLTNDITGFHPQAYWNNLTGGSGSLALPINSSNVANPTITVTWATSGEWGVGTGNQDATERMLNGMVTSFSTTEESAQTVTISGVPSGNHSLYLYAVQVPLEFFNMDFAVVTHDSGGNDIIQRRYIRPLNSDEYNPSPGFSLVTSDTADTRGVGNMMRFDDLQPGADGIIQIRFFSPGRVDLPGGDPIRGPGLNGLQLVLNAPSVGAPPVITRQPVSANAIVGGQVTLVVEATGPGLTYQWLKNGQTITGATDSQFTLSNLQTNDTGNFSVVVSNPAGRVASRTAVVGVVASAEITFGLITHFKFDESGELTAVNSAPGGQNGQVQGGTPAAVAGRIGNGLELNGATTYVFVPTYPKVSRALTVAGWVQPNGVGPIVNNWVEGQNTGSSGQFLVDLIQENGVPTVRAQIEVGPNRVLATAPLDGVQSDPFDWHQFAVSANGVTLSIYWDGQLLTTVDYLGSINSTPSLPWLSLGAALTADSPPVLDPIQNPNLLYGNLDDVALWNRSLSGIELQGIYNGGLAGLNVAEVPPVLNINRSPIANNDLVSTPQGVPITVSVLANDTDPDGDTLDVTSVTAPAHGTATLISSNNTVVYVPAAGYAGADSFRYSIGDGHGGIASATVQITVTAPPPVITCSPNLVAEATGGLTPVTYTVTAVDFAGAPAAVTCVPPSGTGFRLGTSNVVCTATDTAGQSSSCSFTVTVADTTPPVVTCNPNIVVEPTTPGGAVVTYIASASDAGGLASFDCTPASGSTFPVGLTTVVCVAVDVAGNRDSCSFTVTVGTPNTPPLADASATATSVISGNNSNAVVHLDGIRSSDADGDALTYAWFVDGSLVPIAAGSVADVPMEVGVHTIILVVDDGVASGSATIQVTVVTAGEAIEEVMLKVAQANLGSKNKRPLIASLKSAVASLDRGSFTSAENQLVAFQNKVRAQIGRTDPALAEELISAVQKVIDAL